MKANRSTVIILTLITMALIYLMATTIKKAGEPITPPPVPAKAQMKEAAHIYSIPENNIPTVADIEKNISESEARKKTQEEAATKTAKVTQQQESSAVESAPEKPLPQSTKTTSYVLPKKKEVRFPTYEERHKSQSQSGIVAY